MGSETFWNYSGSCACGLFELDDEVTGRSGEELQNNWPWKKHARTDIIAYLDGELRGNL